jgi:hypothetical protein
MDRVTVFVARIGALLLLSSLAAGCAGPAPTPRDSNTASLEPGTIMIACETPIVPGHCLQPVAWAIQQLPARHVPVASVAIQTINPCPDASPCVGPPHRAEWWAAFTLRDGRQLGMWVVEMMGINNVESVGVDATPPPSAEPATGEFAITCGDIPDATCAGAAGAAPAAGPNKPLRSVRVERDSSGHLLVTLTFDDGTTVTTSVARDSHSLIGWSVKSAAP